MPKTAASSIQTQAAKKNGFWAVLKKYHAFYLMLIPGILYFAIFKYGPMWGLTIAFQNYNPFQGVLGSQFVGLSHFQRFLTSPECGQLFRNTLLLAVFNLVFYFPLPIIIALMLNEVGNKWFQKIVQSLIYIPHFISWVVVVGLCYIMFNNQNGSITQLYNQLTGGQLNILMSAKAFRPMIVIQMMWKEAGWGTIIFLAALAGVDVQLYDAAYIDGATNFQRLWHVTLPSIRGTVVTMFILRLGKFMDTGFDQIYNMLNAMNRDVGEVFDTYIYQLGMVAGQYSYSTAVGFFKSIIALVLVIITDRLSKNMGEDGVF
jgi:putative aldouronate transport system permease protein